MELRLESYLDWGLGVVTNHCHEDVCTAIDLNGISQIHVDSQDCSLLYTRFYVEICDLLPSEVKKTSVNYTLLTT